MARTDRAGIAFLRTHHSTHRILFRFFAKKTEPKNTATVFRYAETGECFALPGSYAGLLPQAEVVEALPGFRCPCHPRGGLRHLCRFVCVTKCGFTSGDRLSPAPTRSDIGNVVARLGL